MALFYAIAHPERTSAVVYLAGTAVRWRNEEDKREARLRRLRSQDRAELEALEQRLASSATDEDQARFLRLLWATDFASPEAAAAALDRQPLYDFPRSAEAGEAVRLDWKRRLDAGIANDIQRLNMPVLVLHGDADPDADGALEVAELAACGRRAVIRNAGHSLWLEQPAAVQEALRAFLRNV